MGMDVFNPGLSKFSAIVFCVSRNVHGSLNILRYSFMITLNDTFDNQQESKYNINLGLALFGLSRYPRDMTF